MALLKDITFTGNLPQTTHILQVWIWALNLPLKEIDALE